MSVLAEGKILDSAAWPRMHCAFCSRDDTRVRFLVSGKSGGMICNTCCLAAVFIFLKAYAVSLLRRKTKTRPRQFSSEERLVALAPQRSS